MSTADRFKPYSPDVQAVIRLEEALPPDHPVHVFVDLIRSLDLVSLSHLVPRARNRTTRMRCSGFWPGATYMVCAPRANWPV